ncbi:MAG: hypothetical protein IPK76_05455 [Lewinellaceae bacterium]|nr:hypothetical protein [Lewinellaceae bacterium]
MNTPPPQKPGYWIPVCTALLLVCSPLLQAQRNAPYYNANAAALRQKLAEKTTASIQTAFREPGQFSKEAKEATGLPATASGWTYPKRSANLPSWMMCCGLLSKRHAAIVAANPEGAATKVILTINPTPNAYSVGDGTLSCIAACWPVSKTKTNWLCPVPRNRALPAGACHQRMARDRYFPRQGVQGKGESGK